MHFELLKLLSDGKFHSGEKLADMLAVSRTSIWKMIPRIQALGLDLHTVKGKGYKLTEPLDLLEQEKIFGNIPADKRKQFLDIQIFPSIDSTSTYVMERLRSGELNLAGNRIFVCLAEQQMAGKGRRGRTWVSPFGHNIYLTLVREFNNGLSELEGLSLVMGLAVTKVLERNRVHGLGLKWPNDILWQGKKLAGILLEISGDPTGVSQVLIGLGLNISISPDVMKDVDQAWVDIQTVVGTVPDRNRLTAELLSEMATFLDKFQQLGFAAFKAEWEKHDALNQQQVVLKSHGRQTREIMGKVLGVNTQGALMLQTENGVETFHGGEISPRLIQENRLNDYT